MREILGRVEDCMLMAGVDLYLGPKFSRPRRGRVNDGSQPGNTPQAFLPLSSQAGPFTHPLSLFETMSFPQTRPQLSLSLDTFKSHDNLVDPNATAFTPNAQHKSYFLDTSVSLFSHTMTDFQTLTSCRRSKRAISLMKTMET